MKNFRLLLFLFLLTILPTLVFSQDKKPKVALVLSGGGAKGIAHIPLLQTIDSLGIVPDLIIGNSMGSIVGGLYAMGYSGDSIASIAKNLDWNHLLGGDISLSNVSVEEKKEFNRYLVDIDIVNGNPKISASILNDQNLREFLSIITYPVYNINDFDDLPIPFRAMTTDLVNGNELLIDDGLINVAMRASMSIPGAFKPVSLKNTLLVDGGILNNFPVDVAKRMGADIIIGSDVGGGMEPIEELDNIAAIIFQTTMLNSNLKNPENRKLCDILVDHIPNLTHSTGDFSKSNAIYEEGKIATTKQKKKLEELAIKLSPYTQRDHKLPEVTPGLVLDSIIYTDISEANIDLVKARMNLQTQKTYSRKELFDRVDRAIGTQIFSEIQYHPLKTHDNKIGIEIQGFEHSKHQVKGALHYDNSQGFGLLLNYTGRNIIGTASRFITTIDLAEQPKIRLQYQKNFGKRKNLWWNTEFYGENIEQEHYIAGKKGDELDHQYLNYNIQLNKNINSLSNFVGVSINYNYSFLQPIIAPATNNNVYDLVFFKSNVIEMNVLFEHNTMNEPFFPTSGTYIHSGFIRSLSQTLDISFYENPSYNKKGNTNNFNKIEFNFEKRISFGKNTSAIFGLDTGFIFVDKLEGDDISSLENAFTSQFILGGNIQRPRKNTYVFKGLNEGELNVTQYMKLNLELQYSPFDSFYFTPHLSVASVGFDNFSSYIETAFSPKGNWGNGVESSLLSSIGATASYNSILGPIELDISFVNRVEKARFFLKVGIELGKSK